MAVETWEKYRLELVPLELDGLNRWAAYLAVYEFDESRQDFVCVLEKQRVWPQQVFSSESEAVDAARRASEAWIRTGALPRE